MRPTKFCWVVFGFFFDKETHPADARGATVQVLSCPPGLGHRIPPDTEQRWNLCPRQSGTRAPGSAPTPPSSSKRRVGWVTLSARWSSQTAHINTTTPRFGRTGGPAMISPPERARPRRAGESYEEKCERRQETREALRRRGHHAHSARRPGRPEEQPQSPRQREFLRRRNLGGTAGELSAPILLQVTLHSHHAPA